MSMESILVKEVSTVLPAGFKLFDLHVNESGSVLFFLETPRGRATIVVSGGDNLIARFQELLGSFEKEIAMPSKTKKQAKFMAACAHGAEYKNCPPEKVAKEFNKADKGTGILKGKKKP